MKLVEILAKKLDVWPTGAAIAVQDGDARKMVKFGSKHANPSIALMGLKDVWQARDWKYTHQSDFDHSVLASDWKTAIVTHDQWQAERDRQKGGEWKRHRAGRNQPVNAGVRVEVKLRCGDVQQGNAHEFIWLHSECDVAANIMQYRVISLPQAEEVEVDKFCMGENCNATAESIAHSHECEAEHEASYTGAWDQMETPFKWRDEITELNAYIEKYTREREALIERLASEGFALIPPVVSVVSEFSGAGMIFPIDEWQIGDIVQVVSVSDESAAPLGVFKITDIDASEPKYELDKQYFPNHNQMKFIRRP